LTFIFIVTGFGTIGHLTTLFTILGVGIIGIVGIDLIITTDGIDLIIHGIIGTKDHGIIPVIT
jgi:hypothetical protein|tara:strand:- start:304 stop:492 length:189 start_codon:yes stop_codon:yes gene_type:complete